MSTSFLTKKALANSLKQLMEHTPLNKITVRHLVEDCGLNRQTFYYHFQDIFELLGWIYRTEAVEGIARYRSYSTWTDGFYRIFVILKITRPSAVIHWIPSAELIWIPTCMR